MALNAVDVNAGDDILAVHNNALIDDIEQHDHDGVDTNDDFDHLNIAPAGATIGLDIVQANNQRGIKINTESADHPGLEILCKNGIAVTQDVSSGYGLFIQRNLNEVGASPLATFKEDHVTSTQDVVYIHNDGAGREIGFANAVTRYVSIMGSAFHAEDGSNQTYRDLFSDAYLRDSDGTFALKKWIAQVNLPHGAIVTSVKMFYYQSDNVATLSMNLERDDRAAASALMATCTDQNIATAYGSHEDTTIINATIDNVTYSYYLLATIDNNADADDIYLCGVTISYTILEPLP